MISRRHTREYLLSTLYTRSYRFVNEDNQIDDIYFDADFLSKIDTKYIKTLESAILKNESHLLAVIQALAPKFDLETMPRIHVCILLIAFAEILYWSPEDINNKISVNEALELAKSFSDTHGKNFIHGVLSSFLKKREKFESIPETSYRFFAS